MAVKKIPVISVILAGGRGVRMGGIGKASILLGDIPLIQHVINRINKQVDNIVISGSLSDKDINNLGYEVIPDIFTENGGSGPLSGIHAGLTKAHQIYGYESLVLTVPTDGPFLPKNLSSTLMEAFLLKNNIKISVSSSNGRIHPTTAMWSTSLLKPLESSLRDGIRKIDIFTNSYKTKIFEWDTTPDPFFNINTFEDLKTAEKMYNT